MATNKERVAARREREDQAEAARLQERSRSWVRGVAIGLVLVAVLGLGYWSSHHHAQHLDLGKLVAAGDSRYSVVVGPADAPHTVIVYEDFLCPYCEQLEAYSRDRLSALAEKGQVEVDYRPFQLLGDGSDGSYSVRAASAFAVVLQASGPKVAKTFHDLLFEHQPSEGGPYPSDADLVDDAVEAGADRSAVADGIEHTSMTSWVHAATAQAHSIDVSETPTVIIDGKQLTDYSSYHDLADKVVEAVS